MRPVFAVAKSGLVTFLVVVTIMRQFQLVRQLQDYNDKTRQRSFEITNHIQAHRRARVTTHRRNSEDNSHLAGLEKARPPQDQEAKIFSSIGQSEDWRNPIPSNNLSETPRFSIVIPVQNEEDNIEPLVQEIDTEMAAPSTLSSSTILTFEVILVDDGSTDGTSGKISEMQNKFSWLRTIRHAAPCGQSAAIRSGVLAAKATIICTMDGDGQNPPSEIPKVVAPLLLEEDDNSRANKRTDDRSKRLGLVAGQRVNRQDPVSKKIASRLANAIRAYVLNDYETKDTGCGLKAFPRYFFLELPFFDHMHRYLPALVKREQQFATRYVDVSHRPRFTGSSKYNNWNRAAEGWTDLLGVWWLIHRCVVPTIVHEEEI